MCAALVALFRPAGGPASHASPPSGGTAHTSGDDADTAAAAASGRNRYTSPLSPSPGPSLWAGRQQARRVSENAPSSRGHELFGMGQSDKSGFGANVRRTAKGADDGFAAGNGYAGGGGVGTRRARHNGMLKRSASYTAGPESLDMEDMSTSSSDGEEIMDSTATRGGGVGDGGGGGAGGGRVQSHQQQQQQRAPSGTPPRSGRSGRLPNSPHSSESPDAIMRSRMIGFGSADLGMDDKPKRTGRTSSIRPPWARFTDNDKKTPAAAAAAAARLRNAGIDVEDRMAAAALAEARQNNAGAGASSVQPPAVSAAPPQPAAVTTASATAAVAMVMPPEKRAAEGPITVPLGRDNSSPLAVRIEDRLNLESLRRPATAPAGGGGAGIAAAPAPTANFEGRRPSTRQGQGGEPPPGYAHMHAQRAKMRAANTSSPPPPPPPPGRHGGGKAGGPPSAPVLSRPRVSSAPPAETAPTRREASPPYHNEIDNVFAFSRRSDISPPRSVPFPTPAPSPAPISASAAARAPGLAPMPKPKHAPVRYTAPATPAVAAPTPLAAPAPAPVHASMTVRALVASPPRGRDDQSDAPFGAARVIPPMHRPLSASQQRQQQQNHQQQRQQQQQGTYNTKQQHAVVSEQQQRCFM